jgi:hypothetical protein
MEAEDISTATKKCAVCKKTFSYDKFPLLKTKKGMKVGQRRTSCDTCVDRESKQYCEVKATSKVVLAAEKGSSKPKAETETMPAIELSSFGDLLGDCTGKLDMDVNVDISSLFIHLPKSVQTSFVISY